MRKEELWSIVSELCVQEGVTLFDVEVPPGRSGVLRVFIETEGGIQHTHCAGVSHRILNHERVEEMIPGNVLLEVSSPGINRKLTRPEHFKGAVGERLKVSYQTSEGAKTTVTGDLKQFEKEMLHLSVEKGKKEQVELSIPVTAIKEARVDFLFE